MSQHEEMGAVGLVSSMFSINLELQWSLFQPGCVNPLVLGMERFHVKERIVNV